MQVVVMGAGINGLAIAREIAKKTRAKVTLLDKESKWISCLV